jgi:hypothetical protein
MSVLFRPRFITAGFTKKKLTDNSAIDISFFFLHNFILSCSFVALATQYSTMSLLMQKASILLLRIAISGLLLTSVEVIAKDLSSVDSILFLDQDSLNQIKVKIATKNLD